MSETFTLSEFEDESLDYVIGMPLPVKRDYFHKLVESFYPKSINRQEEYESLWKVYVFIEKLYRSNRFFKEKFTMIYTKTGLVRNIVKIVLLLFIVQLVESNFINPKIYVKILEIREYGKLRMGFSGGTDSIFLNCLKI